MNSRDTRWTYGLGAICAVITLLVAAAPAAAVDSAVREYSLNLPNPGGKSLTGSQVPTARPSELAPFVRRALKKSSDGTALATVATSPDLGAPDGKQTGTAPGESGGGQTPSVAAAVVRALDDAALILGVLALLGVIGFVAFLARAARAGTEA